VWSLVLLNWKQACRPKGFISFSLLLNGDAHQVLLPAANDSPRITASDDGYLILNYDDFLSENLLLIRKDNSEDLTDEEFSRLSELVFMFGAQASSIASSSGIH